MACKHCTCKKTASEQIELESIFDSFRNGAKKQMADMIDEKYKTSPIESFLNDLRKTDVNAATALQYIHAYVAQRNK